MDLVDKVKITYTKPLVKQIAKHRKRGKHYLYLLENRTHIVLEKFPELKDVKEIRYHLTTMQCAGAIDMWGFYKGKRDVVNISVNPEYRPSYNTIGHEFMHFVQAMKDNSIPSTEIACDIFLLARSSLFLDECPSYLLIPRYVRDDWNDLWIYETYKTSHINKTQRLVRRLCVEAIEQRNNGNRRYVCWLTRRLKENLERNWRN